MSKQLDTLDHLATLTPGWDSYGAAAIDKRCIADCRLLLEMLRPEWSQQAIIVPTSSGGVQVEWHMAITDLEVEINP